MKKSELIMEYDNVLREYMKLDHMKLIKYNPNIPSNIHYYLPYHAVVKFDRLREKFELFLINLGKTRTATASMMYYIFFQPYNRI